MVIDYKGFREVNGVEIPKKFENLMVGVDLKASYLCAWNADKRSVLEEEFIAWCDDNNVIDWN